MFDRCSGRVAGTGCSRLGSLSCHMKLIFWLAHSRFCYMKQIMLLFPFLNMGSNLLRFRSLLCYIKPNVLLVRSLFHHMKPNLLIFFHSLSCYTNPCADVCCRAMVGWGGGSFLEPCTAVDTNSCAGPIEGRGQSVYNSETTLPFFFNFSHY